MITITQLQNKFHPFIHFEHSSLSPKRFKIAFQIKCISPTTTYTNSMPKQYNSLL